MLVDTLRWVVAAAFGAAAAIAVGSWAVTTRRLSPFGWPARTIRRLSDPVLLPVERALLTRGANPQNAPWWLLGGVIVGGILLVSLVQFVGNAVWTIERSVRGGPRSLVRLAIWAASNLLIVSLVVRVVGSWMGAGRFNRMTRWAWLLTDWLVEPIRRWLPPFGMFDFSPFAAWFVVWLAQGILLSLF